MKPGLRNIAQWRMHNLGVWGSRAKRPAEVVAQLGAMQAQEFPYAKWSVALRTADATEVDIDRLFDSGAFLRTHILRPTWHFVTPADIGWMLRLTAPRVMKMLTTYDRQLDLTEKLYTRTNRLITKALANGEHLTRKEVVEVLTRAKIQGDGRRFGHILLRAELEGLICSGKRKGREQTYAVLEERAPKGRDLAGDDALVELAHRYFTTRAPATLKDLSWWASLKMVDCRKAVGLLGDDLEQRDVDDRTYYYPRGSEPPKLVKGTIDLVQVYDECVVSYTLSRDALTAPVEADISRDIMFFWHPILLDGQIIGHWRRRTKGKDIWLEMLTYRKLMGAKARALDVAVGRYEAFVGQTLEVEMSQDP